MNVKIIPISAFPNGFNKDKFLNEIEVGITTNSWAKCSIISEALNIVFNNEISELEHTQIDSLVLAHNGAITEAQKTATITTPSGETIEFKINANDIPELNGSVLLTSGKNIQGGEISFNNEKLKNIIFEKPFTKKPLIDLTMSDSISQPPYRINVTTTGFTIKTQVNFTGIIEWKAINI